MPPRPGLIKDIETIKNTVDQLDDGDTPSLASKGLKDAMARVTEAAQQDAPGCQETQDLTDINGHAQDGLMNPDELHHASKIAVRVGAGTIGQPPAPKRRM